MSADYPVVSAFAGALGSSCETNTGSSGATIFSVMHAFIVESKFAFSFSFTSPDLAIKASEKAYRLSSRDNSPLRKADLEST